MAVMVIVEIRVPLGSSMSESLRLAASLEPEGLELDRSYQPVPVESTPDIAGELEAQSERLVIVRGKVEEDRIPALEKHPLVSRVWKDTPIEPFGL